MPLAIDLEQSEPYWTLKLEGDLDYGECASLRMSIDRILRSSPASTVIDLTGLDYIDSSGLGLLLSLSKEYGAQGGRLVLVTNDTVNNVLNMTRLSGIFSTAATMDDALAILGAATA